MSRLLKEDAAVIGQAYEKILSEALYGGGQEEGKIPGFPRGAQAMPHRIVTGNKGVNIVATDFKTKIDPITNKVKHLFLSYLSNPDWEAKDELLKGFNSKISADTRATIATQFANDLLAHLTELFESYPEGIHPGKKYGKDTSNVGFYELSDELVPWVLNWQFETTTGKKFTLIKKARLAKWVADQMIKQVLEAQDTMEYIPAEGERGFESSGSAGGLNDIQGEIEVAPRPPKF